MDQNQLIVLRRKIDLLFKDRDLISRVLIEADLAIPSTCGLSSIGESG